MSPSQEEKLKEKVQEDLRTMMIQHSKEGTNGQYFNLEITNSNS